MNNRIVAIVIGAILLISLLLFSMAYAVRFNEVAIVTTFGEPSTVQQEEGLHLKWPAPIQSTKKFDTRLQTVNTRLETHATRDGLQVIAQAYVFWKINPDAVLKFNDAYGSIEQAADEIEARMRSAGGAISEFEFDQLIGANNRLADVENQIAARLRNAGSGSETLDQLGVQIESVGIQRIYLPVDTTRKVVERMKKERDELAEEIRSEGEAQALAIKSEARRQAQAILDHASRLAATIRGQGDTLAAKAMERMSVDPQFATFLLWLDALEKSATGATTYVVPAMWAPYHLLDFENFDQMTRNGAVPQPPQELPTANPELGEVELPVTLDGASATGEEQARRDTGNE